MNVRTLLLVTTLALPLAIPVAAHPSHEGKAEKLLESLNLDDGRTEEVRQILQHFHEQRRAVHEQAKERMKELHKAKHEQLQQVLTEEEMEKLKAKKSAMHAKHRKHGKEKHPMHDQQR
jgi:phosphoserine phosphatase